MDKFSSRLQLLRKSMNYTQKDFASFLEIPQPSLSGYENGKVSPTLDVLKIIATKCHVSIDWLCGISSSPNQFSTIGDIANFIYLLDDLQDIHFDLEINKHENTAKIAFDGNSIKNPNNTSIVNLLTLINEDRNDFLSYSSTKEKYDSLKQKNIDYYSALPLFQKRYENLDQKTLIRKRLEYLENQLKNL